MQNPRNLPAILPMGSGESNLEGISPRLTRVRSESVDRNFSNYVCLTYRLEMMNNPHKENICGRVINTQA